MLKRDILAMFDEAVLKCEGEYRLMLNVISDYDGVISELEEKKPKVGQKELDHVLNAVKIRTAEFVDCVRKKPTISELLGKMEGELDKLEKTYLGEMTCDIDVIVDGMAEVSTLCTMALIKIKEEYPETMRKVERNKSTGKYEPKKGEHVDPDTLKILNQYDKLFTRFTDAGTEIPTGCSCSRK